MQYTIYTHIYKQLFFRRRRSGKLSLLAFGGRVKRKPNFAVQVEPLNTLELPLDDHIDPLNPTTTDNEYIAVTTFGAEEKKGDFMCFVSVQRLK